MFKRKLQLIFLAFLVSDRTRFVVLAFEKDGFLHADPDLAVPNFPFNHTLNYMGNWCSNQAKVSSGEVGIKLALEGETITVALPNTTQDHGYVNMRNDGLIDANNPGLYVELMNEVARRGKFNWRFGIHQNIRDQTGEDFIVYNMSDLLVWLTENFDVVANWWLELPSRVNRGVTFPKGWYDASIIIIAREKPTKSQFNTFSWSRPFTTNVWILLGITLFLTAIVSLLLEETVTLPNFELAEIEKLSSKITLYIYKCFITFTGHMDLDTRTKPGHLVGFSLSFFAMLMLSAYTANLASFLVNKNSPQSEVYTVGDIVNQRKSMCILDAAKKEAIMAQYPQALFVKKDSEVDAIKGLINFECDYAISGISGWEELKNNQVINEGCALKRVGQIFKHYEAGFAMRSDSGVHCTSLLREVFHIHFLEMHDNGFIRERWGNHIQRNQVGPTCSAEADTEENSDILTVTNVGGIFVIHAICLFIAIISSFIGKTYNKKCRTPLSRTSLARSISSRFVRRQSMTSSNDDGISGTNEDLAFLRRQVMMINDKLDGITIDDYRRQETTADSARKKISLQLPTVEQTTTCSPFPLEERKSDDSISI
jgi:hypothetical protein